MQKPEASHTSAARDYFNKVYAASLQALAASGTVTHTIQIDGHAIRLNFAGEVMASAMMSALMHLEIEEQEAPDLTICIWDSVTTGQRIPPPPWEPEDHQPRGAIHGFNDGSIRTANMPALDGFSMLDYELGKAIHWDANAAAITHHERSFPLRVIVNWWAARRGLQFAHAGAVGTPEGGVIIVGKGRSGKSTTALSCLGSGLLYAGDDHVLLRAGPQPHVYSLYNTAKLHPHHLQRLPHLVPHISNANHLDAEKALLYIHQAFPDQVSTGFPVKAILLPRVTDQADTCIMPTGGAAALAALAPSSIFLLPGEDRQAFRHFAQFVRRVPSYELHLGTDIAQIPIEIHRLLASL
jgi:hypothetical protein